MQGRNTVPWIMPSLLALALVVSGFLHYKARTGIPVRNDANALIPPSGSAAKSNTTLDLTLPGRVMANITVEELMSIHSQYTEAQANTMTQHHIGTWIGILGKVCDVKMLTTDRVMVALAPNLGQLVFCSFASGHKQRCFVLRKGDEIRVSGEIEKVNSLGIHLVNCEFA
jgi:hypothetical protein